MRPLSLNQLQLFILSSLIQIFLLNPSLSSVMVVEHLNCGHECTHTDLVILRIAHLLGFVVNSVEFSNLVTDANSFKQRFDGCSVSRHLEVNL